MSSGIKHGMHGTRLHKLWLSMKSRCAYKGDTNYKFYGGRGITVCDEWKADFMSFYSWAISNGYSDELSIDRIDSNGNYEPSNCRWVTMKEQFSNRRSNRVITLDGVSKTQQQWAEIIGKSHTAFCQARKRGLDEVEYLRKSLEMGRGGRIDGKKNTTSITNRQATVRRKHYESR